MKYSMIKAAEAVGIGKTTMHRRIKDGVISATKVDGGYEIDAAELARVYPDEYMRHINGTGAETPHRNDAEPRGTGDETPNETNALRTEIKMLREMLARADLDRQTDRKLLSETIDDLRGRLDEEGAERRTLNARLLTYTTPPEPPVQPPNDGTRHNRGLFHGWFRKAS